MSPAWAYLPADVQRLVSTHAANMAALELYVDDDGTPLVNPVTIATYIGERLFEAHCPLPDVLHAVALCAGKMATAPLMVEAS